MIPFFRNLWNSLLHDEAVVRNWIHGTVGVLAASGAAYAEQLVQLGMPSHWAAYLKIGAVLAAFGLAAHNAPAPR